MKTFFKELYEYNHFSNSKFIEFFSAHPQIENSKCHELMSHVLNAQNVWNGRILSTGTFHVWEIHDIKSLGRIASENQNTSMEIISGKDLSAIITYTNTRGEKYENSIRDILFHVINHSTYHRGQMASLLKSMSLGPPVTDYIFYKREN
jgi:uncharacterized damage-inducible protein DinB